MIVVNLIFYLIALQSDSSTLIVDVNQTKRGWCYIVSSKKQRYGNMIVESDSNGIAYFNQNNYRRIRKVLILRGGLDITDQVKFLSKTEHEIYKDDSNHEKYELTKFFIPLNEDSDWDDPDVYYKYSREEKEYRDKLIREGKIKFN